MIGAVGSRSNGHCIALNNIGNFLKSSTQLERSNLLVNFSSSNKDDANIISTEGCFACDMNKANKKTKIRSRHDQSRGGRRGKKFRNRDNLLGRNRRHKRNHKNIHVSENHSKSIRLYSKRREKRTLRIHSNDSGFTRKVNRTMENPLAVSFKTLNNRFDQQFSSNELVQSKPPKANSTLRTKLEQLDTHEVERLAITLSREETRKDRYNRIQNLNVFVNFCGNTQHFILF